MRPIDADKLADEFYHMPELVYTDAIARCIEMQPTVDAVPVVHGHWIPTQKVMSIGIINGRQCSACGGIFVGKAENGSNYCEKCGAKMDKWKEGELDDQHSDVLASD